jgi:hypothetical protein
MKSNDYFPLLFGLVILIFLISAFIFSNRFDYVFTNGLLPIFAGIFTSIVAIVLQDKSKKYKSFNRLCQEIHENYQRMSEPAISAQLSRMCSIHQHLLSDPEPPQWVGFEKTILVWVIDRDPNPINVDHYRYLPNNELKNFINSGLMSEVPRGIVDNLILYYLACEGYSRDTQNIEKNILMNQQGFFGAPRFQTDNCMIFDLNIRIAQIESLTAMYKPRIDHGYKDLQAYFSVFAPWELVFESLRRE